jgi:hypothetical protein
MVPLPCDAITLVQYAQLTKLHFHGIHADYIERTNHSEAVVFTTSYVKRSISSVSQILSYVKYITDRARKTC